MTTVHSLPPMIGECPRILILGSMPGVASLSAQQYYAHSRNVFWPIMGELFGAAPSLPYSERVNVLSCSGVAVWDVLELCTRHGSLDSSIVDSSIVPNDFARLFRDHPTIDRVFFNGAKAESSFLRHVGALVLGRSVPMIRLPSTSPAHASMSFDAKLSAWRAVATTDSKSGQSQRHSNPVRALRDANGK